jgi:hypothetical protein
MSSGCASPTCGRAMSEVVTLGETMALMKADTLRPLAHTASLSLGIGGAVSNVAIALQIRHLVRTRWRRQPRRSGLARAPC